jgi:hypothetical protein
VPAGSPLQTSKTRAQAIIGMRSYYRLSVRVYQFRPCVSMSCLCVGAKCAFVYFVLRFLPCLLLPKAVSDSLDFSHTRNLPRQLSRDLWSESWSGGTGIEGRGMTNERPLELPIRSFCAGLRNSVSIWRFACSWSEGPVEEAHAEIAMGTDGEAAAAPGGGAIHTQTDDTLQATEPTGHQAE